MLVSLSGLDQIYCAFRWERPGQLTWSVHNAYTLPNVSSCNPSNDTIPAARGQVPFLRVSEINSSSLIAQDSKNDR
jgi:hypothetical protein